MTYPEQQPWFPEEQSLAEEALGLFVESLTGQYRALVPFVSAENIKKYSFRIGAFVKSFVEQYPSQDSSRLSLFSDMLEVIFQVPDQKGRFFLETNVRDDECCSQIIVDPLSRMVPRDQKAMLQVIVQESLAAISRQLQVTIHRIREGVDEECDVIFLKVLGGRADIIKSFHDYLRVSQPLAPAIRLRDVTHGILAEVLKSVSDPMEQLQVPKAIGNRIELVSKAVTNAILGLRSQLLITRDEVRDEKDQVIHAGVHLDVSINDRLLPGVLVEHLRHLFEQLDTHDLWDWTDAPPQS